jgi:hypothetical protein
LTDDRELRTLRRRQAELADRLARDPGDTLAQGPALLVKVFAETAVPTATLKYFACHPVKVGGAESEGTAPTLTADASQKLYVAVLGGPVPVAGDYLIARLVGGRWVAGKGAGAAPPAPTCGSISILVNGCNSKAVAGSVVTLTYKQVVSVAVTNGGSGYTSPPTVVFATTNGNGASAVAVLTGGAVTSVNVVTGGIYTAAPLITFSGGGGSGAAATSTLSAPITVDTIPTNIGLFSITVVNNGSGYSGDVGAPTVTISGGGGTGAVATAVLSLVSMTGVTLTAGGSGYTSAPSVSASGGGGTATITARLTAGPVTGLKLAGGSGYTTGTGYAVGFTGGGGTGAAGTFDVDANGAVTNVALTAGGTGYISAPAIDFSGHGGTNAHGFATIGGGAVTALFLESGSGYTVGTGYALGFSGGNGTGAAGTFDVSSGGRVTNLAITAGGSGYTTTPALTFPGAGSGSGATATVLLGPTSVGSLVLGGGINYTSTPTLTIFGGGGTGATGTATIASQNVASVSVSRGGRDFTSAPTVTIGPPPSGTTATATATLATAENSVFYTPAAGKYTASVTPPAGTPWWSTAPVTADVLVLNCSSNATATITLVPATGYSCHCVQCRDANPDTCTVTDPNGTYTATWQSGSGAWICCYQLSGQTVLTPPSCTAPASTGSVAVAYAVFCPTGATPFRISETWSGCGPGSTSLLPGTCSATGVVAGNAASNTGTITGTGGGATKNCNDSVSFAMTGALVNGTVAVTFP